MLIPTPDEAVALLVNGEMDRWNSFCKNLPSWRHYRESTQARDDPAGSRFPRPETGGRQARRSRGLRSSEGGGPVLMHAGSREMRSSRRNAGGNEAQWTRRMRSRGARPPQVRLHPIAVREIESRPLPIRRRRIASEFRRMQPGRSRLLEGSSTRAGFARALARSGLCRLEIPDDQFRVVGYARRGLHRGEPRLIEIRRREGRRCRLHRNCPCRRRSRQRRRLEIEGVRGSPDPVERNRRRCGRSLSEGCGEGAAIRHDRRLLERQRNRCVEDRHRWPIRDRNRRRQRLFQHRPISAEEIAGRNLGDAGGQVARRQAGSRHARRSCVEAARAFEGTQNSRAAGMVRTIGNSCSLGR